jgi:hypothetical protein
VKHHKNLNAVKTGLRMNLEKLDKRTNEGKVVKQVLVMLREFIGIENINPLTEMLCHQITYKFVRLSMHQATMLSNRESKESAYYLPMSNSLRLDIGMLQQLIGTTQKLPDLSEYISKKYGKKNESKHN